MEKRVFTTTPEHDRAGEALRLEARVRIELTIEVLQTSALPLGYRARHHVQTKSTCGGWAARNWSGRRDLNPRLRPWQGRTLPLSYSRSVASIINKPYVRSNGAAHDSVPICFRPGGSRRSLRRSPRFKILIMLG